MLSRMELKQSICQRCYYMRHGNAFVEVKVDPKEYEDMVSKIKPTRSMVVMVVDLMDIEGSIVPNLGEIIGHHKPLIVVGNKADLIAPDGPHYLKNIAFELRQACNRAQLHNVKRVELISAKTGFGIEKLISTLFKYYHMEVDVYIVGTANAGKSSLFNILLGSDYCRPAVRDQELIQRATVTEWPGTTLNFLKFPIAKPGKKFSELRNKRLKKYQAQRLEDERLLIEQGKEYETQATWELKEEIKPTDMKLTKILQREMEAKAWGQTAISFTGTPSGKIKTASQVKDRLAATHFREEMYEKCFWVYDTPGIINPDQVMNQLPPEDNSLVSPPGAVVPRVAMLRPGMTLFVSGLARLDLLECKELVHVTVHASSALPIQVGLTEEADNYYQAKLGTDFLKVPSLYHNQLNKVPALQSVNFEFNGDGVERSAADIQLSSIGFVSVRGHMFTPVRVRAWTPGGVGLSLREPSMLPYIKAYRGSRIHGSYLYETLPQGSALVGKETKNVLDYAARKKREVAISQQKLDKRYST